MPGPNLREKKYRNKDHDNMMSYLRDNKHPLYAWNYHAERAADYIDKLEAKLALLPQATGEELEACRDANVQKKKRIAELEAEVNRLNKALEDERQF